MKPLRVLHVVTSLDPGGMENGICNLAHALTARGIESSVACLERSGPFASRLPDPGAGQVLGKRSGFSPKAVFGLWRAVRRRRPSVVHTHNIGPLVYGALATFWGRSVPLLQGEHSQLAPWELTPKRLGQRRRLYRACRAIHTVSEPQRQELIQLGFPADRISSIPNGVDTSRFHPGDRAASRRLLGLPEDATITGLVGRFGPHKGHRVLLEAFGRVGVSAPNTALVLLGGGGSEEQSIRQAVSDHPLRARIYITGFRSDLEACYPALDLLVLPSTNEGMSNAALEAMACGVPVLANSGAGNEAIVQHGKDGWVTDLRRPEALATAMAARLADRDELRVAGENARQTVESRLSLVQMVDAYDRLYRRVAE
jgi:glycosyltransferase involved in cell wall biosynthesis